MTRIARSVLMGALVLAVGAKAYASEPAQTKGATPGQTTPAPNAMKKDAPWSPKASPDTSYMTPPGATEGRLWVYVSGEVIDVFCYLDRGFTGEIHRECAMICIRGGMPMGLLTQKGEIYILFPNHEWAMDKQQATYSKPYRQLIDWAARQVQVGGYLVERKGMKGIEIYESKLLQEFLLPKGGLDSTSVQPPDSTGPEMP
jgi:hypothetical protein